MCSSQTSIHDDAESISPHDLTTKAEPTKVLKQPELPTRQHTHTLSNQTILNAAKLTGDGLPAILTDLLQITWQLTSWMKVKGNLDFWYIIFTGLVSFWNMKKITCETSPAEIFYFVTSVLVQPEIGVECIQKCMRATAVRSEPARGEKVKF